jgi:hypothetical protein
VRSHEPNVNGAAAEEYHCHQAVVISLYVENVTVITDEINGIKTPADVSEALPISRFALEKPLFQRISYGRVGCGKVPNRSVADNDHADLKQKTRPLPAAFQK